MMNIKHLYVYFQVVGKSFISAKQGSEIAKEVGAVSYIECSSLSGHGVEDLAQEIVTAFHKSWDTQCTKKTKCCECCLL